MTDKSFPNTDVRTQYMYQQMDSTWVGLIFACFQESSPKVGLVLSQRWLIGPFAVILSPPPISFQVGRVEIACFQSYQDDNGSCVEFGILPPPSSTSLFAAAFHRYDRLDVSLTIRDDAVRAPRPTAGIASLTDIILAEERHAFESAMLCVSLEKKCVWQRLIFHSLSSHTSTCTSPHQLLTRAQNNATYERSLTQLLADHALPLLRSALISSVEVLFFSPHFSLLLWLPRSLEARQAAAQAQRKRLQQIRTQGGVTASWSRTVSPHRPSSAPPSDEPLRRPSRAPPAPPGGGAGAAGVASSFTPPRRSLSDASGVGGGLYAAASTVIPEESYQVLATMDPSTAGERSGSPVMMVHSPVL